MATADYLLPVWPFMPNWRDGVLERLSWATVVMGSETGSEQRFSSRLSPRREFEVTFNPLGNARTFFDLFISELGGQEMMIPLWHDQHKVATAVDIGDGRIDCDTAYGEFVDGGMALLVGDDEWSHKAVRIDTVDANGFTLVAVTDFAWPVGGLVLPMRRSRIDEQPTLKNLTGSVGESNMRFILNQANDLPDYGAWDGLVYGGYPVVTIPSEWSQGVDLTFSRIMETEDNGTGIAFVRDIADRGFRSKKHTWHINGRQANWEFRQFLYRMAGRRSPVWMPTGMDDMYVQVQANAGQGYAQVGRVGLTYVGGPQPGRDRVLAQTNQGFQVRRITGLGAPALPTYERINFDSNLTYTLPIGTRLSLLEIMRADGDDIELMHHVDTEGVTECSINFRSFSDARTSPTPISVDIPVGFNGPSICSSPADGEDSCTTYNPWSAMWSWDWVDSPTNPAHDFFLYGYGLPQDITSGMMPNGRTLAAGTSIHQGASGQVNRFVPALGFNLVGHWDNNNPDGSFGGPIYGWRVTYGTSGGASEIEYYFFFPLVGSPAFNRIDTQIQSGAWGEVGVTSGKRFSINVTYQNGVTVNQGAMTTGSVFPHSFNFYV